MPDKPVAPHARGAFLAHDLERVAKLIVIQADALLQDAGLPFPSRAVSTVLLIQERGSISTAEIAAILEQPHQLVTQRVELLLASGVIERPGDPSDRRRKPLTLTAKGVTQVQALLPLLTRVERVFQDLSAELGCDLGSLSQRLIDQLRGRSLADRVSSHQDPGR